MGIKDVIINKKKKGQTSDKKKKTAISLSIFCFWKKSQFQNGKQRKIEHFPDIKFKKQTNKFEPLFLNDGK